MKKDKKKLDDLTKTKLLIQGEYILIALIFLVIGILKLVGIIDSNSTSTKAHIFNFITIAGGVWIIVDFVWVLLSKKRKAKNDILDKCLNLPIGIFLIVYDVICFVNWNTPNNELNRIGVSIVFFLVFASYGFQGVYHWFKPSKQVLQAVEEMKKAEEEEKQKEIDAKNKETEISNNEDKQ